MKNWNDLQKAISESKARSAWTRGVRQYASEIISEISQWVCPFDDFRAMKPSRRKEHCMNGAQSWRSYSEGGCALIRDFDIAERLCSPSELKKLTRKDGSLRERPNASETWLECQARALHQAMRLINTLMRDL